VRFAVGFTTLTINAPKHIEYLYNRLKTQYGVIFIRQKLPTIQAAFADSSTKLVFNCTGNASRTLPGVEDAECYPTRGQVVLVCAPKVHTNVMRHGKDYETYIIPRPQSNGNVVLGGYMQKGRESVLYSPVPLRTSLDYMLLTVTHPGMEARTDTKQRTFSTVRMVSAPN
jgi:D-amino-acid oxidase